MNLEMCCLSTRVLSLLTFIFQNGDNSHIHTTLHYSDNTTITPYTS